MASNDEGQGSGDCDNAYLAADKFLSLADDQRMLLLGPLVASGTETDMHTGAQTETGAETRPALRLRPVLRLTPASRPALRLKPASRLVEPV